MNKEKEKLMNGLEEGLLRSHSEDSDGDSEAVGKSTSTGSTAATQSSSSYSSTLGMSCNDPQNPHEDEVRPADDAYMMVLNDDVTTTSILTTDNVARNSTSSSILDPFGTSGRRIVCIVLCVYLTCVSVSSAVVHNVTSTEKCDSSLDSFVLANSITSALLAALSCYSAIALTADWTELASNSPLALQHGCRWLSVGLLRQLVGFVDFVFLIRGIIAVFSASTCSETSPLLYFFSLGLIILGFIGTIVPVSISVLFAYYYRDFIFRPELFMEPERHRAATCEEIDRCPIIIYTFAVNDPKAASNHESHRANGQEVCAICYTDYNEGDILRQLPCDHKFHQTCVDDWFQIRDCCPLCKCRLCEATAKNITPSRPGTPPSSITAEVMPMLSLAASPVVVSARLAAVNAALRRVRRANSNGESIELSTDLNV